MRRPPATVFISTLLCGIFLQNLFVVLFGPEARAGPPLFSASLVRLGPIEISQQSAGIVLVASLLIALQFSSFGRPRSAESCARRRRTARWRRRSASRRCWLIAITFGLGASLAGVAGALLANQYFVWPTGGVTLTVFAYMAVVIGGWGSIPGRWSARC